MPGKKTVIAILIATLTVLTLSSCGEPKESKKIKSIQRKDKRLNCKEVLLEINEAEHYRRAAIKNKSAHVKDFIMPLGYMTKYMSAEEAIYAAEARIEYLDKIYEILECEESRNSSPELPDLTSDKIYYE